MTMLCEVPKIIDWNKIPRDEGFQTVGELIARTFEADVESSRRLIRQALREMASDEVAARNKEEGGEA